MIMNNNDIEKGIDEVINYMIKYKHLMNVLNVDHNNIITTNLK